MFLTMFKSKIHCAVVTGADLNYAGSITIDQDLLEAAGILPHEKVQVVNNNNGARFDTYTISGPRGSGVICLNGAAARLVQIGDVIIIISYSMMSEKKARNFDPTIVLVDEQNKIKKVAHGKVESLTDLNLDKQEDEWLELIKV